MRLLIRGRQPIFLLSIVLIIIFSISYIFFQTPVHSIVSSKKILYWIDPMEPQIHYEAPGKSRMNMDLIPVYAEDETNDKKSKTTSIRISSAVINNLGVRTADVEEGPLRPIIRSFGIIKANEDNIIHLHSYVEGWVQKLYVKKNQEYVKKDQPLFEIYSHDLRLAQKEYLLSSSYKDFSINKLKSLRVSEKQIEELKKTRKDRPLVTIYAPQKGYIDSLNIREGMWIKPEITIMSLTDLSEVWVIADIFPLQQLVVKSGQEVNVFLPQLPNRVWEGKIDYIYPEIDPVSLTIKVRVRLQNSDFFFKPNMYVAVEIKLSPKSVLKIPKESVIWGEQKQHVIIALGEGNFQSRKVVTGMEDSTHIQIVSGLNKGEKVVTSAQFLLDSEISLKSALQRLESFPLSSDSSHEARDAP